MTKETHVHLQLKSPERSRSSDEERVLNLHNCCLVIHKNTKIQSSGVATPDLQNYLPDGKRLGGTFNYQKLHFSMKTNGNSNNIQVRKSTLILQISV